MIVFPKQLERFRSIIKDDALVKIKGRVSIKEDELPKLICENIEGLEKVNSNKIYIRVKNNDEVKLFNIEILGMLKEHQGNTPIYVFDAEKRQQFRLSSDKWVELDDIVVEILKEKYGEDNIKVM